MALLLDFSTVVEEVKNALPSTIANTASSAYTITLPANSGLLVSDTIQIIDISNNAGSNNLTIGRNSSKINGASEDLTIDVSGAIVSLIYTGSTYGWVVGAV